MRWKVGISQNLIIVLFHFLIFYRGGSRLSCDSFFRRGGNVGIVGVRDVMQCSSKHWQIFLRSQELL